jgi:hypothetical protein
MKKERAAVSIEEKNENNSPDLKEDTDKVATAVK